MDSLSFNQLFIQGWLICHLEIISCGKTINCIKRKLDLKNVSIDHKS